MKYIRLYEDSRYLSGEINFSTLKVGDSVYCINDNGTDLEIGKEYIIKHVWPDREQFRLTDDSRWMGFRFTQDPNHPIIVRANANKYNI